MPTLVLTPRHSPDNQALWRAAHAAGWDVLRLPSWRAPEEAARRVREPVLYVEALFAESLAEEFGVTLLETPDGWLPSLPQEHLRRTVRLSTLGEARRGSGRAFVKPPNDKSFPARVYAPEELPTDFDPECPVLVAEPVSWALEYRGFVLERRCLTASLYARFGEPQQTLDFASLSSEDEGAMSCFEALLADPRVALPDACVVDVGVIEGRGWAVVEANGAWGAGLYACDPDLALQVVRRATVSGRPSPAM